MAEAVKELSYFSEDDVASSAANEETITPQIPVVASIYADTALTETDKYGNQYYHTSDKMIDGSLSTCWTDNVNGYAVGQKIDVTFNDSYAINYLGVYNGHQRRSDLYYENDRISQMTVTFDDGSTEVFNLPDQMGLTQLFFSKVHQTKQIHITIDDLYGGNTWHDVVISELTFDPSVTYAVAPVQKTPATAQNYNYINAASNSRYLSENELWEYDTWTLYLMRNEIYARHGYPFQHQDLKNYFAGQSWYTRGTGFSDSCLSDIEKTNIQTILSVEEQMGSSYLK